MGSGLSSSLSNYNKCEVCCRSNCLSNDLDDVIKQINHLEAEIEKLESKKIENIYKKEKLNRHMQDIYNDLENKN